ncbi:MAG: hypothetical protein ACYDFU_05060 [Nitrospirota bacterium]
MAQRLITDEEMAELREKGCIGLCPMCGMPVYVGQEHDESEATYTIGGALHGLLVGSTGYSGY